MDESVRKSFLPFLKSALNEVEDYNGGKIIMDGLGTFDLSLDSCLWDEKCEKCVKGYKAGFNHNCVGENGDEGNWGGIRGTRWE